MLSYYWFLHILFLPTINPLPSPVKGSRNMPCPNDINYQLPIMLICTCMYSPLARLFSTVYCAASGESGRERTMECIWQVNVLGSSHLLDCMPLIAGQNSGPQSVLYSEVPQHVLLIITAGVGVMGGVLRLVFVLSVSILIFVTVLSYPGA